jgi:hypothetical protein
VPQARRTSLIKTTTSLWLCSPPRFPWMLDNQRPARHHRTSFAGSAVLIWVDVAFDLQVCHLANGRGSTVPPPGGSRDTSGRDKSIPALTLLEQTGASLWLNST